MLDTRPAPTKYNFDQTSHPTNVTSTSAPTWANGVPPKYLDNISLPWLRSLVRNITYNNFFGKRNPFAVRSPPNPPPITPLRYNIHFRLQPAPS